jgi:hypothetical protein
MSKQTTLAIIGPFDTYRVTVNGYRVPYISAVRHDGLISLTLDERFGCDIADDDQATPIIDFIANAMAVAAGYSCFGENSQELNPYRRRSVALNLGAVDDGETLHVEGESN